MVGSVFLWICPSEYSVGEGTAFLVFIWEKYFREKLSCEAGGQVQPLTGKIPPLGSRSLYILVGAMVSMNVKMSHIRTSFTLICILVWNEGAFATEI